MKTGYTRRNFLQGLLGASAVVATGKIWVVGVDLVRPAPFIRRGAFTEHPVDPNRTFELPKHGLKPIPGEPGVFVDPAGKRIALSDFKETTQFDTIVVPESVLRLESVEGHPGLYRNIDTGRIFHNGMASTPPITPAELRRLERQANWRRDGGTFDEDACPKKWRTAFNPPEGTALAV